MSIKKESFGKVNNKNVDLYSLVNKNNLEVRITNFGGIVTQLFTPDRNGTMDNIVLGFEKLTDYLSDHPYFGAIIGRVANRIASGKFSLEGKKYELYINNGPNHLHGGKSGFDKKVWDAEPVENDNYVGLKLHYLSQDMEEGYPGNLNVDIEYRLTNNDELVIEYNAQTDKTTHINLTQHNYYNLNGCKKDVRDHVLQIHAEKYTEVGENSIPSGRIFEVENTPLDFRKPKRIGDDINNVEGGFDHNYVIADDDGKLKKAAEVHDPESGRMMTVETTEPGIQLYTSNYLDGTLTGTGSVTYEKHYGLCLETQHFPNAPNVPHFPSTILKPGNKYHQLTVYRFGIKR
jgi:aldose 1-epimerase